MVKAFVDSSVFFSACYSSTGASREIIKRAISGEIKLVISRHVIEEVERNLEKDAPILAAARQARVDYLVSLDTHHLVGLPNVASCAEIEIVLPREFLKRINN